MQSILIISKNIENLQNKAQKIVEEEKISKFDVETIKTEKSLGIGEIREVQKKIFLKPMQGEKKAVILESFFGATLEAQNAFLKILEEPPLSTIIIILAKSIDIFLPTLLSRCNLIILDKVRKLEGSEFEDSLEILEELKKKNISYALKISQDNGKTKEEAMKFLEELIISAEDLMHKDNLSQKKLAKAIKNIQDTYQTIKNTNVNVRFALENLFLNLF